MKKFLWLFTLMVVACSFAHPATITTPNMELALPVPGTVSGPTWANQLNTAFTLIDSHNHTTGNGVLIPSAGLNINADLQYRNYNLVNPRSIMFTNQDAALASASDTNNVYVVNGNLYFNDSSGTPIQITSGGSVNVGGSGNISGIGGTTAAVTYSDILKSFAFTQSSGVTASISAGTYNLYESVSGANAVSLKSPSALGSNYSLTFPSGLPASTKIMTVSNTGNIGATYDVDNSTIEISGSTIRVKDTGISTAKIANSGVTTAKIADLNVTTAKIGNGQVTQEKLAARATGSTVAAGGVATSGTTGFFSTATGDFVDVPGASVTITTTGRPVSISINNGYFKTQNGTIMIVRNTTSRGSYFITSGGAAGGITVPAGQTYIDLPAAGTYTYKLQARGSIGAMEVSGVSLAAYEL
jgi:hypothetical protein